MVSKAGKLLLKNTIQSTELQNKIKEEKEMWKKWRQEREDRTNTTDRKRKHSDYDYKDRDEAKGAFNEKRHKESDKKPDNYWLKKLMDAEERVSSDRWTHNGFKELYLEELESSDSSEESSEEEVIKRSKKSKKKRKKHKKHRKKSKHKRK